MPDYRPVPTSRFAPTRTSLATARRFAAIAQSESVAKAVIAAETRLARARVESVVEVTEHAILGTSHIGAVAGCLVGSTPWTDRHIVGLAETGCVGLQSVLVRHVQEVS